MKRNSAVRMISREDSGYPDLLREIYDPPNPLYVLGQLPTDGSPCVAVVGSRLTSLYGMRTARAMAADLASAGVVVVSGMATGIDTAAHEGALSVGGRTIAVLGGGFNKLYPAENKKLAEKIMEQGALLTEYAPEVPSLPGYFPRRNRIISGMSLGVLVVEARLKSGALITADLALEQGRDVYAVPGNVDSAKSGGTNWLIQQGAKVALSASDVLRDLNILTPSQISPSREGARQAEESLSAEEQELLSYFDSEPLAADTVLRACAWPTSRVLATLSLLEIKGKLRQLPGKNFARIG